jgi:ubiquinol-cytochrome c reductase subunit 6
MGLSTLFSDIWDTISHPSPDAESPPQGGVSTSTPHSGTDEQSAEEEDVNKKDAEKAKPSEDEVDAGHRPTNVGKEEEDSADEEEEEEEEEEKDIKEVLEEECASSKQCASYKHHYDDCVERVTGQIDNDGKAKEDCVEEFFHLAHCATQCAAPKLFQQLK